MQKEPINTLYFFAKKERWSYFVSEISNVFKFTKEDLNSFKEHGMNMLALIMLDGYNHSINYDKNHNNYNPILQGKWNYPELRQKLITKIEKVNNPELDSIFYSKPTPQIGW